MKNFSTKIALLLSLVILSFGCSSTIYYAPQKYTFQDEIILNENFDKVWTKVVEACLALNMPIEQMDKTNNVIRSKPVAFNNDYQNCDCGRTDSGFGWYSRIENITGWLNAVVSKVDENRTKVKLIFNYQGLFNLYEYNYNYQQYRITKYSNLICNSTGRLETMIINALKN